ncbi:MAG: DsbA family protein [Candidatus Lambdaproteobacteria bacterium]|nr:DsbA family protein [Candidatus Lambdaproteobacteria bacterium]
MQREYDIEIEWVHFPLHPETPQEGVTLEALFAGRDYDIAAAQQRMQGLMQQEGLPYSARNMTYNSRLAQELGKWADSIGRGEALHDALFRAFFVDLVNLAEPDNLLRIAASVGLPVDQAREVLEQRTFKEQVNRDWALSMQLGITGVPTFVAGGYKVVGAQPYEVLQQLMQAAEARRRDAPAGDGE